MSALRRPAPRIIRDFEKANLGDERLTKRAGEIIGRLARQPSAPLPAAMGSSAGLEASYRFMNNRAVTFEKLLTSHSTAAAERARMATSDVLVIHDTTTCHFGNLDPKEIGYLQTGGPGFFLHLALAVDAQQWRRPFGVVHAETIHRSEHSRRGGRKKGTAGSETAKWEDRESLRWNRGISAAAQALKGVANVIHVFDREGDSYGLIHHLLELGQRFVGRVRHDRRARTPGEESWTSLTDVVDGMKGRMTRSVPLSRRGTKTAPRANAAHPARDARTAELEFSAGRVEISRPRYVQAADTLTLNVVRVVEVDPPDGEEPVEWLLYTKDAIRTKDDVARVVDTYRTRWVIEEFNKALKTGCLYEERGFETRHALLTMLALSLPVACELLWLRSRARTEPDADATTILSTDTLTVLRQIAGKLPQKPTAQQALLAIASLGGHLRSNGEPGWLVLQRGLTQLHAYETGWQLARRAEQQGKK